MQSSLKKRLFLASYDFYPVFFDAELLGLGPGWEPNVNLVAVFLGHSVFDRENLFSVKLRQSDFGIKGQEVGGHDAVFNIRAGSGDKGRRIGLVGRAGIGGYCY